MYSTILLALDGSPDSLAGEGLALALARGLGCELLCTHVYDSRIHEDRFREMEPGLPDRYQDPGYLRGLRTSHDGLISEGFRALSRGYLEAFLAEARAAGVAVSERVARGRNYVELLRLAQETQAGLLVLGAQGLGRQGDGLLGSTAARVLRRARCDVLVARAGGRSPGSAGPVLAGVDGSAHGEAALRRAVGLARVLDRPLHLAAAYDPAFHRHIFQTMARSLTPDRQAEVGLERQEELHEELIDDGLGTLYRSFLDRAAALARTLGADPVAELLEGKAYRALVDRGEGLGAALLVVGRFGHNREEGSDLGSHAEAVARLSGSSVLVAAPPAAGAVRKAEVELAWDAEATARLERVPAFARPMARKAVEEAARAQGAGCVTAEAFDAVARRFGMGPPAGGAGGG